MVTDKVLSDAQVNKRIRYATVVGVESQDMTKGIRAVEISYLRCGPLLPIHRTTQDNRILLHKWPPLTCIIDLQRL